MDTQLNAGQLMEQFYKDDYYQTLKKIKGYLGDIKDSIEEELKDNGIMRHEFKQIGYVAKWKRVPQYEFDYVGLNEFLHNLGLLIPTAKISSRGLPEEIKLDLTPFELPSEWSLGIHPNKKGRVSSEPLVIESLLSIKDKLNWYAKYDREKSFLEQEYDKLKKKMLQCTVLNRDKKIKHEYGSVSLKEKKTGYQLQAVLDWYGEDFLMEYAKPEQDKLNEFVARGFISQTDIQIFNKVVDVRLDFIIQTLDSENRMFDFFNQKQSHLMGLSLSS